MKKSILTKVLFVLASYEAMEQDEQPITEVLAYFPEANENRSGTMKMVYAHIGQHSTMHYDFLKTNCKETDFKTYLKLYLELLSIGYNLDVLNADFVVQLANWECLEIKKLQDQDRTRVVSEILTNNN